MNENQLVELVFKSKSIDEISKSFIGLAKSERKKCASTAFAVYKAIVDNGDYARSIVYKNHYTDDPEKAKANKDLTYIKPTLKMFLEKYDVSLHSKEYKKSCYERTVMYDLHASVAVFATCSLSKVKQLSAAIGYRWYAQSTQPIIDILLDRQPDWIDKWLEFELDLDPDLGQRSLVSFDLIYTLWKSGLCQKPNSSRYAYLFVMKFSPDHLWSHSDKKPDFTKIVKFIDNNPDLLEFELWKILEYGAPALIRDSYCKLVDDSHYQDWSKLFLSLINSGQMDREHIIKTIFKGIERMEGSSTLKGFMQFYKDLEISTLELKKYQARVIKLLDSESGPVKTFAINLLTKLEKSNLIDIPLVLTAIEPIFNLPTKSHALLLIKLIDKLLKKNSTNSDLLDILVKALSSPHEDVHRSIAKTLNKHTENLSVAHQNEIEQLTELMSVATRPMVLKLIEKNTTDNLQNNNSIESLSGIEQPEWSEFDQQVSEIDFKTREKFGLNFDYKILKNYPENNLNYNYEHTRLTNEPNRVIPLEGADQVLDLIAVLIEQIDDPVKLELMLDGISRFNVVSCDNYQQRSLPVLKRIDKLHESFSSSGIINCDGMADHFYYLLSGWLNDQYDLDHCKSGEKICGYELFLQSRLWEIMKRKSKGDPGILLSLPTEQTGCICADSLIDRLDQIEKLDVKIYPLDYLQALLRVDLQVSNDALNQLKRIKLNEARALEFALGGKPPTQEDLSNLPYWLLAARRRHPIDSSASYFSKWIKTDKVSVGAFEPLNYKYSMEEQERSIGDETWTYKQLVIKIEKLEKSIFPENYNPDYLRRPNYAGLQKQIKQFVINHGLKNRDSICLFPTLALQQITGEMGGWMSGNPIVIEWSSLLWPYNLDHLFISRLPSINSRIDDNSSREEPNYRVLKPIFDTNIPLSELALFVVAIAINSKDQDVSNLSIDLLIDSIGDGRLNSVNLNKPLLILANINLIKPTRLSKVLKEVSAISMLEKYIVKEIIQNLLSGLEKTPKNAHLLLEVYRDNLISLNQAASEAMRGNLSKMKGKTKLALVAKEIILLNSDDNRLDEKIAFSLASTRLKRAQSYV